MSKETKAATQQSAPQACITGEVQMVAIDQVKPNKWNPNRMTEFQRESTRQGMLEDGWVAAYALLVWGKDKRGRKKNIIIDGEHRWSIAKELGIEQGPMVLLDGLTETQAKEMTVKFDAKRGQFDDAALSELLRSLDTEDESLGMRLGIADADLEKLLSEAPDVLPPEDFSEVTVDAQTAYRCPKCGYEWNGKQK